MGSPSYPSRLRESEILKQITVWLSHKHIHFRRNNTGAMFREYRGKQRIVRFNRSGDPDLVLCVHGKYAVIEVKSITGEQSIKQHQCQEEIERSGGSYCLARCLADVERFVAGLERAE
jgi:hypothetical protein